MIIIDNRVQLSYSFIWKAQIRNSTDSLGGVVEKHYENEVRAGRHSKEESLRKEIFQIISDANREDIFLEDVFERFEKKFKKKKGLEKVFSDSYPKDYKKFLKWREGKK